MYENIYRYTRLYRYYRYVYTVYIIEKLIKSVV